MKLVLIFVLFNVFVFVARSQTFTPFTWPVSNAGPYTVASVITNVTVFTPNSSPSVENDMATHKYSHHTRIWWSDGVTWIAFSSGCTNESDGGTQTALTWSTNCGMTWSSPPLQIIPSQSMWTNDYAADRSARLAMPRNFVIYGTTNYLVAAVDSIEGGNFVGDALLACAVYTNGTIGTPFRISTNSYPVLDGKSVPSFDASLRSALMADTILYGCWGGTRPSSTPVSEWTGWKFRSTPWSEWVVEPNTFSADGSITNLYRIWRVHSLYATNNLFIQQERTTNGGTTWSASRDVTGIPNSPSETVARRLTTGQTVIVGNPQMYVQDTIINGVGARDPLFMAISEPNTTTITNVTALRQGELHNPNYFGNGKSGGAQYPDCIQVGNYLYVSYSLQKERIGFTRVLIPGLQDNNNDGFPTNRNYVANFGTLTIRR